MKQLLLVLALAVSIGVVVGGSPSVALADDPPPISQFVVIEDNGNNDAFLAEAKKTRAIFTRLGIHAERRYFQATIAGDQSGTVALAIEYPNLQALAEAQRKLANDKEWQAYIQRLTKKGVGIASNSIWAEVTP